MITIYSKDNCVFCDRAKTLLDSKGVAYEEIRVDKDISAKNFLIEQGHRSVPQIYKNGAVFVNGYKGLADLDESVFQQLREQSNAN